MNKNKFTVFPAIHLRDGKVVRFTQGDIDNPVVFHTDPIACAQQWIDQGAEWLQLVNLDAALNEDASHNWKLIEQIARLPVKIQFGGGIRNIDDVHWAFKSGIDRVVFGTGAVENPQLVAQAIAAYGGDAILLALDTDALGEVKIHGWKAGGSIQAVALAIQMRQIGVTTAIHTSIHQDGSMSGVDLDSAIDLAAMSGLRIIVGGGIGNLQDIRDCILHDAIDGVIIGKALYTGNVDLGQALNLSNRIDSFETGVDNWKADQKKHWNKFGYQLVEHNLKKHIPVDSPPLRILDAGGGNGYDSLGLARMNHHIDIADMSQQMLNDARANAALAGVTDRVATHVTDLFGLEKHFAAESFDIVLCHNVMQFIDEGDELLAKLSAVLKPGGFLSLVTTNPYSQPYQAAFVHNDLDLAYKLIDEKIGEDTVFGVAVNEYRPEDIYAWLEKSRLELVKYYGIRCIYNYWGSNELKEDEKLYQKLIKLEMELTERYPYNLTARQFQLILRKV
ncbi:MAG: phosphoribosylformimino-5-aminoimidazole carboxamide ribotide isomerase [Planctomycetota bacterium]|jgi:phosphoribosylformimino-5-aminoimidazole carboxamide ribotide isomerase